MFLFCTMSRWLRIVRNHEADCAAGDGLSDTGQHVLAAEHLQQPQHLDKFASTALGHAGFEQATQRGKFLGQIPANQGGVAV